MELELSLGRIPITGYKPISLVVADRATDSNWHEVQIGVGGIRIRQKHDRRQGGRVIKLSWEDFLKLAVDYKKPSPGITIIEEIPELGMIIERKRKKSGPGIPIASTDNHSTTNGIISNQIRRKQMADEKKVINVDNSDENTDWLHSIAKENKEKRKKIEEPDAVPDSKDIHE